MTSDLRIAARGVGWNYLGSGVVLATQLVYTGLTARLVSPAGFGAYAAAQALVALVSYFGLASIGSAVVRSEREGREVAGTALVIAILAGAATSVGVFLLSAPWAHLWGVPESAEVGRLFSLVVLLTAFGHVPLALLRKKLEYRRAALVESLSHVGGMAVGAAVAVDLRSPLALVIGQVAGSGLTAVLALLASRKALSIRFSRSEARALLVFSGHVSGQSLVYYSLYTAPSLVVSRLFGAVALGGFSRASVMVTLPVTHLSMGITKALYPLIARARGDSSRLRDLIESTVRTTVGVSWPLFAAVAGAAPVVVALVLGPGWSQVDVLLPPMLLFGAANLAYVVTGNPLEVLAFQRVIWRFQALWVGLLGVALTGAALARVSLEAMLWTVAGVQIVVHALKLRVIAHVGLVRLDRVLRSYGAALGISVVFFFATAVVEHATSSGSLGGRVAAEVVTMLGLVSLTTWLLPSAAIAKVVRGGLNLRWKRPRPGRAARPLPEPSHTRGER